MPVKLIPANELTAFAKQCRLKSGKTKGEVAAALGVSRSSMQLAEDYPEQHLNRLRIRIIEMCSDFELEGPLYRLVKRTKRKPPSARDG
jgi:DNA-binding XRE family transcriptional regulator